MKRCSRCGITKPLDEFYFTPRRGWRADCRSCVVAANTRRARDRRAGVPSTPVGTCEDCGSDLRAGTSYLIKPPSVLDDEPFRLCITCWDRLVGAAVMDALR